MPSAEVAGRKLKTQPLWARVDANRAKLSVFVVLFVLGSAVLLTAALVATPGALIALVAEDFVPDYWSLYGLVVTGSFLGMLGVGTLLSAVQLANAEDWVRNRFLGRPLTDGEAPELMRVVADMALAAGLPDAPGGPRARHGQPQRIRNRHGAQARDARAHARHALGLLAG